MRHRSSVHKILIAGVAGLVLAVSAPLMAQAATDIDTTGGTTSPIGTLGYRATPTYAQEIEIPANDSLTSFTIQMKGSPAVVFRGIVYAWNGTTVVGDPLWVGAPRALAGSGAEFEDVTFSTGAIPLVAGQGYVIGATTLLDPDESGNVLEWALAGASFDQSTYPGGDFVYSNAGDITAEWDGSSGWFGDTAFRATFVDVPSVTSVTPTNLLTSGGQTVVITGSDFTDATDVTFGGTAATTYTVDSDTQITAVTPAHAAGTADILVTTDRGVSAAGSAAVTFGVAPNIIDASPDTSSTLGGGAVVLTGTGFTDASAVTFGGTAATSYTVDSDTQITAVTPSAAAGAADVLVTNPFGTSAAGSVAVTFVAPPSLSSVAPDSVSTLGGTSVTLTGSGFTDASAVTFGGTAATSYTVESDTEITAIAPAGTAGSVADVLVTTPYGSSTAGAAAVTYVAPPTVTGATPPTGSAVGGTTIVITGTGFTGATGVTFGGTAATSFTVDSDTQITAVTPAQDAGSADVLVTTPYGVSAAGAAAFTFVAPPVVAGPTADGQTADALGVTGSGAALPLAVGGAGLLLAGLALVAGVARRGSRTELS